MNESVSQSKAILVTMEESLDLGVEVCIPVSTTKAPCTINIEGNQSYWYYWKRPEHKEMIGVEKPNGKNFQAKKAETHVNNGRREDEKVHQNDFSKASITNLLLSRQKHLYWGEDCWTIDWGASSTKVIHTITFLLNCRISCQVHLKIGDKVQ